MTAHLLAGGFFLAALALAATVIAAGLRRAIRRARLLPDACSEERTCS